MYVLSFRGVLANGTIGDICFFVKQFTSLEFVNGNCQWQSYYPNFILQYLDNHQ